MGLEKIAPGVWWLTGFPRGAVNVYLLEDVLVDGATRWAAGRIRRALRQRPPRQVALTHCHPDHQGVVRNICDTYAAPLACHEADAAVMEGHEPMRPYNWILRLGMRVWAGPPHPVARRLNDGDEIAGFRVVHAPGHTPGHVIFFRDADRLAIAGDLLANLNFITWRPGLREPPWFFSADPALNRASLRRLAELEPRLICFGHGPPLRKPELLHRYVARRLGST